MTKTRTRTQKAMTEMTKRHSEKGVVLILSLLLMMTVSVLAASLMFLSQTETYASKNYRLMSQARYGAESGVHKAANYLLNNYAVPGGAGDPLANYNMNVSPVTFNNQPVVLSSNAAVASNYPVAAVQTAFLNAAAGSLAAGNTTVQYAVSAKLLSMFQFTEYGTSTPAVVQTWEITSDGSITGLRDAVVEVSSVLERQAVSAETYAAFATGDGCGAITLGGNATTNSYDSTAPRNADGTVVFSNTKGNVGTNGNLTIGGTTTVNGTLSTPRTGVGRARCRGGSVDAESSSGSATVTGGLVHLPQSVAYTTPDLPNPLPGTAAQDITSGTTCGTWANCVTNSNGNLTFAGGTQDAPAAFGNVTATASSTIHLGSSTPGVCPCYYNFNTLSMAGTSQLVIDGGPVIMNVAGQSGNPPPSQWASTALNLAGNGIVNNSLDPSNLQILYGGTGNITMRGTASNAAVVYAPNASITIVGGAELYGSLLGASITNTDGTAIHYDASLLKKFLTAGQYMLTSFTWKKF